MIPALQGGKVGALKSGRTAPVLNVLRGEMSLVGPRPLPPDEMLFPILTPCASMCIQA